MPCMNFADSKLISENLSCAEVEQSDSLLTSNNEITDKNEEKHSLTNNILSMPFIDFDDLQPIMPSDDNIELSSNTFCFDKSVNEKKKEDTVVSSVNDKHNNIKYCSDTFQINTNEEFYNIQGEDQKSFRQNVDLLNKFSDLNEEEKVLPTNNHKNVTVKEEDVEPILNEGSMKSECEKTVLSSQLEILYLSKETYDLMRKSKKLKVVVEDCLKSQRGLIKELYLSKKSCDVLEKCQPFEMDLDNYMQVDKKVNPVRVPEKEVFKIPDIDDSIFEGISSEEDYVNKLILKQTYRLKKYKNSKSYRKFPKHMPPSIPKPILILFNEVEKTVFTPCKFELRVNDLINTLTNPNYSTCSKDIIFYIMKYLSRMQRSPFLYYNEIKDPSLLLPPIEKCIVMALLRINSQSKAYFENFLSDLIANIHQIILGIHTLSLQGLCSLCRVLTYVCRMTERRKEPIILGCEILKMKHKYSPMLVACIVVAWKELFQLSSDSKREEVACFGTIEFVVQNWTQIQPLSKKENHNEGLMHFEYKICVDVLKKLTSLEKIKMNKEFVDFLMNLIKEKCFNEYSEEFLLVTPLVLCTACKSWEWAKCNIIEKHILPCISKYGDVDENEKAFYFFCKLYAEILLFAPENSKPENIFLNLFETGDVDIDSDCEIPFPLLKEAGERKYMQDAFAMCAVHLLLSKNQRLPDTLRVWISNNENNPKLPDLRFTCHRGILRVKEDFGIEDIIY